MGRPAGRGLPVAPPGVDPAGINQLNSIYIFILIDL